MILYHCQEATGHTDNHLVGGRKELMEQSMTAIEAVGGRKELMEQSMTAIEAARLIDWLKAKGMTDADAIDAIRYIATGIQEQDQAQ